MAVVLGRDHFAGSAHGLGGDGVDGEGVLAEHGVQAGRQVGAGDQVEDVVGTVAQGDLGRGHAAALGEAALELEAVAIRVAGQFGQLATDGLQRPGARAEGVFVAGQFDDAGRIEIQLASQFIHRLARHVGRKFLHARLGKGEEVTAHKQCSWFLWSR
ncbi:hypothetical protein D3C84_483750 [compost metagenome]